MVGRYPHCTFDLNPCAPSIDTPLHSFIPAKHVDHMHPNAVIAVAASKRGKELTREIFGDEIEWTSWQRPGFDLGLVLQDLCRKKPALKGAILGQHGLINWADDDKACYDLTLRLIEKASRFIQSKDKGAKTFGGQRYQPLSDAARDSLLADLLPWLRGKLSASKRVFGTIQSTPAVLQFVNSADAGVWPSSGPSFDPDHFHCGPKIKPLLVVLESTDRGRRGPPPKLESGLTRSTAKDYASYYERLQAPRLARDAGSPTRP